MRQMQLHRAGTIALAAILLTACGAAPGPAVDASAAAPGTTAVDGAPEAGDADALHERARQAMQDSRLFAPVGDNALEHYLALRTRSPGDARVDAALVDLQPQLVIAIEQAIANGADPESRRLLALLARMDAQAPALPRLRATVANAETVARQRELAVDAESRDKAQRAEADLRRLAQESAARLAAERTTAAASSRPATSTPATVQPAPAPPAPPQARIASEAPVRNAATASAPTEEPLRQSAPPPTVQVAAMAAKYLAAPKLLRDVAPRYPDGGGRTRQSGQVQVAFTIDPQGGVESPRVVASNLPAAFDRAALAAAARWKFEATGSSQPGSRTVRFDPPGG